MLCTFSFLFVPVPFTFSHLYSYNPIRDITTKVPFFSLHSFHSSQEKYKTEGKMKRKENSTQDSTQESLNHFVIPFPSSLAFSPDLFSPQYSRHFIKQASNWFPLIIRSKDEWVVC